MCIIAQFEAAKIGLKLNVRRNPADGYWGAIFRKTPFYMSTWSPRPTADIILSSLFHSEAPYNESQFKSERVDQLLVDGRAQTEVGDFTITDRQTPCSFECGSHGVGSFATRTEATSLYLLRKDRPATASSSSPISAPRYRLILFGFF